MTFFPGSEVKIDDEARVQRGEHAGKAGAVREVIGDRILIVPNPGASWGAFWINTDDVAIVR